MQRKCCRPKINISSGLDRVTLRVMDGHQASSQSTMSSMTPKTQTFHRRQCLLLLEVPWSMLVVKNVGMDNVCCPRLVQAFSRCLCGV
jgi:hypothetical protein